jgi:uncharacterized protein (DUF1778 family)
MSGRLPDVINVQNLRRENHHMQRASQLQNIEPRAKGERLEARVSAELKAMFQRAAELKGLTLTDYVINVLVDSSQQVIRDHEVITWTGRNREVFLQALMNPPPPAPSLVAAFARYRKIIENEQPTKGPVQRGHRKARSKS